MTQYTLPITNAYTFKDDGREYRVHTGSTQVDKTTYPQFTVIDRATYKRVIGAGLAPAALVKLSSYTREPKISDLTQAYLLAFQNVFYRWYFGYDVYTPNEGKLLSSAEMNYVGEMVKAAAIDPTYDHSLSADRPSYEIQLVDDQSLLIVVENGFLHHLTQSKDTAKGFVLSLLRCLDKFGLTSSQLNAFYLKLTTIPSFETVVKVRCGL